MTNSVFDVNFRHNKYHLNNLKKHMNTVVPFLGAGTSKAYGYPLWSDFIEKIITILENSLVETDNEYPNKIKQIEDTKKLLREKNLMGAIDNLEQTFGRLNAYIELAMLLILENEAQKANLSSMIKEKDTGLWGKYLNMFPSRKYVTTNYDLVIENVLNANIILSNDKDHVKQLTPLDFIQQSLGEKKQVENEFVVYHLHGYFSEPDTLVFSSTNYDDFYGRLSTTFSLTRGLPKELSKINNEYNFLFIGCSLNTVQDRIYETLRNINGRTFTGLSNYAFINKNEVKDLDKKEHELMGLNIKTLWYSATPGKDDEYQQAIKMLCSIIFSEIENTPKETEIRTDQFEIKKDIQIPFNYSSGKNYRFYIVDSEGIFYLTDKGTTYEELNEIFELKEPDVRKNLSRIAELYKKDGLTVERTGKNEKQRWIMIKMKNKEGDEAFEQEIKEATYKLIACISFMDSMRIFYI